MKTYYDILELSPSATEEEIKEQYRFLIQAWHPDKFSNPAQKARAQEKAKEINQAYDTLGKLEKRRQYDREILSSKSQPAAQPSPSRPAPPHDPQPPTASGWERPESHRAAPPPDPWMGISPLADFKWLLQFGDEYNYVLDDRETKALGGGEFEYRLADWAIIDDRHARAFWQRQGYQVEVLQPPYKLVTGETSRCVTGQASLTSVHVSLERETCAPVHFGILLNLAFRGDDPRDFRQRPSGQGPGVADSFYSFCVDCMGQWELRTVHGYQEERGTLVEHGYAHEIQRSFQRGWPLELVGVIRDSPPPDRDKVRVRLGINNTLVCDTFISGHAWRRGGVIVDYPSPESGDFVPRIRFSDFRSYFLTQR